MKSLCEVLTIITLACLVMFVAAIASVVWGTP